MLKTIATFKDKDTHDLFCGKRVKKLEKITELQTFLSERNIFTTSWGKLGKENIKF